MITVHCVHFGGEFQGLADAFEASARRHFPTADLQVWRCPPPPLGGLPNGCAYNAEKLRLWGRLACEAKTKTILIDADTLILGDLSGAFDQSFDVAYTARPDSARHRLNGGVVFLRPTERARGFMRRWVEIDDEMVASRPLAERAAGLHGGVNQAALCSLLDDGAANADVIGLPCSIWNSVDETWASFGDHVKVLHFKSELRAAALRNGRRDLRNRQPSERARMEHIDRLGEMWKTYARRTGVAA